MIKTSNNKFLEKQIKKLKQLADKYLDKDKYSYFLFGSRISGNPRFNSDIDFGIWKSEKIDLVEFLKIKRLIQENIDWPIDVVDFTRVDEDFKKEVLADKILIWNATKDFLKILKNYKKHTSL